MARSPRSSRRHGGAAVLLALIATIVACGGGSESGSGGGEADSGTVRVLLTQVSDDELRGTEVGGSGEELVFVNGDDSVAVEHLDAHRRDELAVTITWSRDTAGNMVADRIAD